ncbi:hypothetical protein H5410_019147 [Solanum commersonii]|uniref:Uncharacterized protein n=1 Tax=Solanum commersonii TaxID=4109 RepID=A0A9J6A4V0_SOLCO|nr:hypothetical protein H5410_019147 [Solanum commersonii]
MFLFYKELTFSLSLSSTFKIEIPAKCGSSQSKDQKEKKNEAKKRVSLANQKGKKRKGKIVETPFDSNSDFVSEMKKKKNKCENCSIFKTINKKNKKTKKRNQKSQYPKKAKKNCFGDCGLYTCLFAEYISNEIFDMRSVDIDAKYHRQRYATIIWHYGKTKNNDGATNESEVTCTVASKFGGPRIAKEHASNTSNYPTPRSRRSNLR